MALGFPGRGQAAGAATPQTPGAYALLWLSHMTLASLIVPQFPLVAEVQS